MQLKPLQQWICDTCGEVISKPEDGYVEFRTDENGRYIDFRIVHHKPASPRPHETNGCYHYTQGTHLDEYVGANGLVHLLSLLDAGTYHRPVFEPETKEIRKWVEFVRRLQTPYYEEARLYWNKALSDGYFDGANEVFMYLPSTLERLVEYYSAQNDA